MDTLPEKPSSPNGIRTRVATLRGWCPRPLDDGASDHRDDPSPMLSPSLLPLGSREVRLPVFRHLHHSCADPSTATWRCRPRLGEMTTRSRSPVKHQRILQPAATSDPQVTEAP